MDRELDASKRYAELRCRTNFSFLKGASHPDELVSRAHELGLHALAVTDRNGVYGAPKAHFAAKNCPGFRLIVGAEVVFSGDAPPLTFLARNRAGYGLMCRLLTEVHRDKPKGQGALEWALFSRMLADPANAGGWDGLFVLAPPRHPGLAELKEVFAGGPEPRLYLTLSRFLDGKDARRTREALASAKAHGLPIVATNDVHYHVPERARLHDVLTSIDHSLPLLKLGKRVFSNSERHLKSPAEMIRLFADFPEAIDNTVKIADACTFSMKELRYVYPSEWIPAGETAQSYLERQVAEGAKRRYPDGVPEDVARMIRHELKLIEELRYADYFLTIWDIVEYARSKRILCQGRGSSANSVVCYCLGITAIDPVRMNLLFERFLSKERDEPPDIDVDFEHERREEVIQHIYAKYGRHRAAMVCTYVTYRTRGSLRDARRAFGIKDGETPAEPLNGKIDAIAQELQGFPRHLSIHSGGFTLSADSLTEIVPVEPATMEGRTVIQWDKNDLEDLGLLKVDFLSLGMLTAIRKTFDLVGDPKLGMYSIPHDDPKTYEMIRAADTVGVFQIESRAQMNMLGRLQPRNFYDLVIEVAIVRPGPIVGKMVHPYLKRRRGLEPVEMPHPDLGPILGRTLGVPLFQEQVMKMAIVLADFTPGEADQLRRAIAAWRSSGSIDAIGERLRSGFLKKGLAREFVDRVFEQIKGFAEYGFPESHSASFALIAYVSCYLKCHYPAEFACALMNSQPMGFYPVHSLIDDVKRHGVKVLPPDPNVSVWDHVLENGAIRLGWRIIKGMSEGDAEALIAARAERPFEGLRDFVNRAGVRRNVLYTLARADAFKGFGFDSRHALWEILNHEVLLRGEPEARAEQLNLFSWMASDSGAERGVFPMMQPVEHIKADYEAMGASTRGHPMVSLRWKLKSLPKTTSREVRELPHGRRIRASGLVLIRQRPPTAKGVVFATLEDENGFLDLILHAKVYDRYEEVFMENCFLTISGVIQRDLRTVSILVQQVHTLFDAPKEAAAKAEPAASAGEDAQPARIDTRTYFRRGSTHWQQPG